MMRNCWPTKKLGNPETSIIIMGQSPPSKTYNKNREGLPFYQGKKDFGELYPLPAVWCSSPTKIAEVNDVLISVRAPIGPTNLCREKSAIGRGLAALRANPKNLNYKFLFLYLKSIENEWIRPGTTFSAIKRSDLENLQIPLPPLNIQKQIVAKIEEVFERIDKAIEMRKKALEETKQIFSSALQEVFGEAEKRWSIRKLGEISNIFAGSSAPQGQKYFENGEDPFVRVQDLGRYGKTKNLVEIKDKVNDLALKDHRLVLAKKELFYFLKAAQQFLLIVELFWV